jgi:hypothetical protein
MLARLRAVDPACAAVAGLFALVMFMIAGTDPFWSDWGVQVGNVVSLLMQGEVSRFVEEAPATYLPSLTLRSPLFLLAALFGGNEDDAFFVAKGFALLLLAGLAAWLMTHARARGADWKVLLLIAFLVAGSPIALQSLQYGHAEDLMAAFLSIAGVLAASRGRLTTAGVVLALAFVLKQWPILAWLPALAVAPRRPWQILATAVPVAALFFVPLLFREAGGNPILSTEAGSVWRSHQWFWPLGVENPNFGPKSPWPKQSPDWFVPIPRLLIVGLSVPLTALWYRRFKRGDAHRHDVLLLLAVLFLGRVVLEPWNIDYYHLPLVLTLATWEVLRGRVPILSLLATAGTYFSFTTWLEFQVYGHATYVMYASWTVPLAVVLVRRLLFPGLTIALPAGRAGGNAQGVQPVSR